MISGFMKKMRVHYVITHAYHTYHAYRATCQYNKKMYFNKTQIHFLLGID